MAEPREDTSKRPSTTDEVTELWQLLGDLGDAAPPAPSAAGWKVEPLPTAAEGGIAAMFTSAAGAGDDRGQAPPPPDPTGVSPLVPETLRGADTLESLLAPAASTDSVASPGLAGPPSLDTFASDAPALGSQPPAWGPFPGTPPIQSGRARLAEMLEDLPDEPTPRMTPDDVHIDRPVVAPAAIWFWGDDDIYPGGTTGAGRPAPKAKVSRSRRTLAKPAMLDGIRRRRG